MKAVVRVRSLGVFLGLMGAWALVPAAFAHGNHHHHGPLVQAKPANKTQAEAFVLIGQAYAARVQPIFEKKCFDCHGDQTHYPWYYKIPGVKQYIDHDIHKAHRHLVFSKGYPFLSHASPWEDVDAIHDEISDNDMPPWDYRLMHPSSALTAAEKQTIFQWVDQSEAELEKVGIHGEEGH